MSCSGCAFHSVNPRCPSSLTFPVFFQAVGASVKSSLLTIVRTLVLFVPLGFVFSRFGLQFFWLTFPITEVLTSTVGVLLYRKFLAEAYRRMSKTPQQQ